MEETRSKVSEKSTERYNNVLDAHEKSKELDKLTKDLTKEIQSLSREKETIEKQRTEAIKMRTQLELDDRDLQEKIFGNIKAKVSQMSFTEPLIISVCITEDNRWLER